VDMIVCEGLETTMRMDVRIRLLCVKGSKTSMSAMAVE
jgi:hypothetical protein